MTVAFDWYRRGVASKSRDLDFGVRGGELKGVDNSIESVYAMVG